MGFWDGKKVVVAGGAGFIGSHVVEELLRRGRGIRVTVADNLSNGRRRNLAGLPVRLAAADLTDSDDCLRVCRGQEIVLNLAARVRGVGYSKTHPATMFRDNMLLTSNVLEAARRRSVERVLVVSSASVYPRHCNIPTPESEGFDGLPDPANEGYGWAKRMAEYQARAYREEFGLKVAIARPYNCYGPRDHFDLETAHVIPSLLRRVWAKENPIQVWGDGTQTRSFLFVEDLARGLLDLTERYAEADPVNLGTAEEVKISELVRLVLEAAGSKARVRFDPTKPAGQPRRNCDATKAREKAGFQAQVTLREGLRRTVAWLRGRGARALAA